MKGKRRPAGGRPCRGFTLVETLIALVLSSLVIILVSTTFLVQNRHQTNQVLRAGVQDNARAATDLLVGELRSSMRDGVVLAGRRTLTVRSPVALATVCARSGFLGTVVDLHIDGGIPGIDTGEIAGAALHDATNGEWWYERVDWSFIDGGGVGSAGRCAANGADTTGAAGHFHSARRFFLVFGFLSTPDVGDLVMLFRETRFTIRPSEFEPSSLGLFRQPYGRAAVEFASGIDTTAHFRYRLGGAAYQDTVNASDVGNVDAVRIVLDARGRARSGSGDDVTFGWATNRLLRNAP